MPMFDFLQAFWFWAISSVFMVFFLLDGFDMGIGMVLPFFPGEKAERKVLLDVTWPFWDGNELWAIIGGALVLAAFPRAFVAILGSSAPLVAILLVFLMFRAISFEAWYRDPIRRTFWEFSQAAGSLVLSFGLGVLIGNLITGLPMTAAGGAGFSPVSVFQPFAILTGCLSASAAILRGAAYLRKKTSGSVREGATRLAITVLPVATFLAAATLVWTLVLVPGSIQKPVFWIGGLGAGVAGIALFITLRRGDDRAPFLWSTVATIAFWIAGSSALFPYLVRPTLGSTGLSLAAAASSDSTLTFLAVFTTLSLAIVAGYSVFVYRVFKGKVQPRS